ncbi:MAG: hypothetical protein ACJA0H_000779 [Francisellaceae bacterium]
MRKCYKIILTIIPSLILLGCATKSKNISFKHLKKPDKPSYFLMCPKGKCNIDPNSKSPCFNVSREQLISVWQKMIKDQSRYNLLIDRKFHKQYVQRSYIFNFPDYITVQFYAINGHSSTIALLSFAKYGYYDFGVNEARVTKLMKQLYKTLPICNLVYSKT